VLLALIVVHLGAALWHHFVRRDRVTARMIDGASERSI
jgi:cytochrome b561